MILLVFMVILLQVYVRVQIAITNISFYFRFFMAQCDILITYSYAFYPHLIIRYCNIERFLPCNYLLKSFLEQRYCTQLILVIASVLFQISFVSDSKSGSLA